MDDEADTVSTPMAPISSQYADLGLSISRPDFEREDASAAVHRWRSRAENAESRIASKQFIAVLLDGNQLRFRDKHVQAGPQGAALAMDSIISQAKEANSALHRMPADFQVCIDIIVDVNRLAEEMIREGRLKSAAELRGFLRCLAACHPAFSYVDCPSQSSINATIKARYEDLYLENCHCRHIFLGLGQSSPYYDVLNEYREDEFTLSKTTLVRCSFPIVLPFTVTEFLAIAEAPLIDLGGSNTIGEGIAVRMATSCTADELLCVPDNATELDGPILVPSSGGLVPQQLQSDDSQSVSAGAGSTTSSKRSVMSSQTSGSSGPDAAKIGSTWRGSKLRASILDPSKTVSHPPHDRAAAPLRVAAQWAWEDECNPSGYSPLPSSDPWTPLPFNASGADQPPQHKDQDPNLSRTAAITSIWRKPQPPTEPKRIQPVARRSRFPNSHSLNDANQDVASAQSAVVDFPGSQAPPSRWPRLYNVYLNKHGQRVDKKLPPLSAAQRHAFDQLPRLCNDFHFKGMCPREPCQYVHGDIGNDTLLALRHAARTLPCENGPACRAHDCYRAHRCTNTKHGYYRCGEFEANGMHSVRDLTWVEVIQPQRQYLS